MKDTEQIRFLTANYSYLQGLRIVPIGLLLLLINWWGNWQRGPNRDLALPILWAAGTLVLLVVIDRYYARTFGQVQRRTQNRHIGWLFVAAFGALGIIAFGLDTSLELPVSIGGLVFAACLIADYLRMTWPMPLRALAFYPIAPVIAALIAVVSLLPSLGRQWWLAIGIAEPVRGVMIIIGLLVIALGVLGHMFLVRTLQIVHKEVAHDQPV